MHGHALLENLAAIVLVGSGAVLVPAAWLNSRHPGANGGRLRQPMPPAPAIHLVRYRAIAAAACSLGAAVIHFAVAPHHLTEYFPFGVAFIAIAVCQALSGMAFLLSGIRGLRGVAIILNAGVIGVWAWSRAIGLPLGPEAWMPEAIGTADAAASFLELLLIALLLVPAERLASGAWGRRLVDFASIAV
ncbi:MAG: hypothetical protein ACRDGH_14590, partial [Candidatus Limnocylindria bacterium]